MAKLIRKRSTTIFISDWKSPYGLFAENKETCKIRMYTKYKQKTKLY